MIKWFFLIIIGVSTVSSCATVNMIKYYNENKTHLDKIQANYKESYKIKPFSIEFTDKAFNNIFLEVITDSIKYIYEFNITETKLPDTLRKFNLKTPAIPSLITSMKAIRCRWVSNLDYYVDGKPESLIFMSVKRREFRWPFTAQKYYILTYFNQPQYFDAEGRLMDNRSRKRLRKVNGDVFKRVNSKVAYTVSERYR
jgi:hypothetical protein